MAALVKVAVAKEGAEMEAASEAAEEPGACQQAAWVDTEVAAGWAVVETG